MTSAQIERLRRRAAAIGERSSYAPPGMHVDHTAAMQLLGLFKRLRLRDGYRLATIAESDGGNGFGRTFALAEEVFSAGDPGPGAIQAEGGDVLEAVEADGSFDAFLQASIFARESHE